jgi:hypothetical protein
MSLIVYQEDDTLFFTVFLGGYALLAEGVTGQTTSDLTVRALVHSGTPSLTDITADVAIDELDATNKPGWYQIEIDTSDATGTGWDAGNTISIFIENDNTPKNWREPPVFMVVCAPQDLQAIDALISSRSSHTAANVWTVGSRALSSGAITTATFASGAIDAAAIAANAIGASELATDAVNEIRDSILSDATPFAGANIAAILADTAAIDALTAATLDATVASRAAPGDAMDLVTDALDAAALASSAVNEIVDQTWEETLSDHSGTVGSTAEALADAATGSLGAIATQVWEYDVESITGSEMAGLKLTDAASLTAKIRRMVSEIAANAGLEVE